MTINPDSRQVGGAHYQRSIQPWHAMEAWMSPEAFEGFLRGNVIKYTARCDDKGGLEDLKKAAHYLEKLISVRQAREAVSELAAAGQQMEAML